MSPQLMKSLLVRQYMAISSNSTKSLSSSMLAAAAEPWCNHDTIMKGKLGTKAISVAWATSPSLYSRQFRCNECRLQHHMLVKKVKVKFDNAFRFRLQNLACQCISQFVRPNGCCSLSYGSNHQNVLPLDATCAKCPPCQQEDMSQMFNDC